MTWHFQRWWKIRSLVSAAKRSLKQIHHNHSTSKVSSNLLDLSKRGLFESVFPENRQQELVNLLSTPQALYCGFDPTADSLHIGNLLSLIVLLHGQRAGHSPIAVVGGATAHIGDPSGKSKERTILSAQEIEANIIATMENIDRVVENHNKYIFKHEGHLPTFRVLNNYDWYKKQDIISFLSTTGRHFRVGEMIAKQSVKNRLNSPEGISCTEFLYQMFQGYDWLHLLENYNCTIQVGGNDQMGNVSSGFDLIHKVTRKYVFGLLVPLILSPGGEKLGKTAGNSVWLNPHKTSPFEFYQYFFNMPDSVVERYLKVFTFLSLEEIDAVMELQNKALDQRHGQRKLAEQLTLLVHGESGLASAERCTDILFRNSLSSLTALSFSELSEVFKDAPTSDVVYNPEQTVLDLCRQIRCFKVDYHAEAILRDGGVYINMERVTQNLALKDGNFVLPNNATLVRIGKKRYHIVKWLK